MPAYSVHAGGGTAGVIVGKEGYKLWRFKQLGGWRQTGEGGEQWLQALRTGSLDTQL